jgi:competence protein ComEC
VLALPLPQHVPVHHPTDVCGSHVIGGARVDVLAPCPDESPDRPPNDNSFVLRIAYGRRAMLFEGDAEREEEGAIVARYGASLHADVLKVGHHGSKTSSTPALLRAVSPAFAVVSCGVRNRYGHPFPATLSALRDSGARVLRTDRSGAVTVTTDGVGLVVDEVREGP